MAVEVAITFRVRRRWLLTLAKWVAKVNRPLARRMAMHTIVEYRQKSGANSRALWHRIDMKEAMSQ